jgi:hypothetical protein
LTPLERRAGGQVCVAVGEEPAGLPGWARHPPHRWLVNRQERLEGRPTRVAWGNADGRLPEGEPDEGEPDVRFGEGRSGIHGDGVSPRWEIPGSGSRA